MGITVRLNKSPLGIPFEAAYGKISAAEYSNGPEGPSLFYKLDFYASKEARFADAHAQVVVSQVFLIDHQEGLDLPAQAYAHLKSLGDYDDPGKGFAMDMQQAVDELIDPPRPNPWPNPDDIPGGMANPAHPDHAAWLAQQGE